MEVKLGVTRVGVGPVVSSDTQGGIFSVECGPKYVGLHENC